MHSETDGTLTLVYIEYYLEAVYKEKLKTARGKVNRVE
jgi:hypothetical protein